MNDRACGRGSLVFRQIISGSKNRASHVRGMSKRCLTKAEADSFTPMAMCTRDNGSMTRPAQSLITRVGQITITKFEINLNEFIDLVCKPQRAKFCL